MTELDRLKDRVRSDMEKLADPAGVRDAFTITQHYQQMGYDFTHEEIEAVVRKVGDDLGYNIA